jgi:hypothetical protein
MTRITMSERSIEPIDLIDEAIVELRVVHSIMFETGMSDVQWSWKSQRYCLTRWISWAPPGKCSISKMPCHPENQARRW